ncbi:MAG: permease [Desulfotomaculum sp.]|nr:permease [Desulfotomaculum sp.]
MKEKIKQYYLFILAAAADIILWYFYPDRGITAVKTAGEYFIEMLLFIPPIFILIGLLDVWVPRKVVENNVGPDSGIKGVLISILAAAAAAGPLYAGFPVAYTLIQKGCRISNAVIFLGTWATIKVPMLMMEIKFMGLDYMLVRLGLTLPAIVITGYVVEYLIGIKQAAASNLDT